MFKNNNYLHLFVAQVLSVGWDFEVISVELDFEVASAGLGFLVVVVSVGRLAVEVFWIVQALSVVAAVDVIVVAGELGYINVVEKLLNIYLSIISEMTLVLFLSHYYLI